jgi:hypothetical protein
MKTHNERFSELEKQYLEYREAGNKKMSDSYINKMYLLIKEISLNYINQYCIKRGLILDREEKAHDSAMFCILQYLKKPGFRIAKISAYAHFGVIKSLFKDKEKEMNTVSYEQYFEKNQE